MREQLKVLTCTAAHLPMCANGHARVARVESLMHLTAVALSVVSGLQRYQTGQHHVQQRVHTRQTHRFRTGTTITIKVRAVDDIL